MTDDSLNHEPSSARSIVGVVVGFIVRVIGFIISVVVTSVIVSLIQDKGGRGVAVTVTDIIIGIGIVGFIVSIFVAFNITSRASRLRRVSQRTWTATTLALAVWIGGQKRRWWAEDWRAAITESPRPIRYGFGLVVAAARMRLYDLGGLLVKVARWVLTSNQRTWWPLGSLLAFAIVNIYLAEGWGSAVCTLPSIVGFHAGVKWLRRQWGIEVKSKRSTEGPNEE
ncbi:hypothetical protein ACFQ08_01755 [Streptosporangium algeriense]|uniref:Uncharacterized protein n=1 Tax=Streptosporangium algeriense TaxID=1682748 RepID=A0ABW3DHC4_9ACTN